MLNKRGEKWLRCTQSTRNFFSAFFFSFGHDKKDFDRKPNRIIRSIIIRCSFAWFTVYKYNRWTYFIECNKFLMMVLISLMLIKKRKKNSNNIHLLTFQNYDIFHISKYISIFDIKKFTLQIFLSNLKNFYLILKKY